MATFLGVINIIVDGTDPNVAGFDPPSPLPSPPTRLQGDMDPAVVAALAGDAQNVEAMTISVGIDTSGNPLALYNLVTVGQQGHAKVIADVIAANAGYSSPYTCPNPNPSNTSLLVTINLSDNGNNHVTVYKNGGSTITTGSCLGSAGGVLLSFVFQCWVVGGRISYGFNVTAGIKVGNAQATGQAFFVAGWTRT